MTLFIYYFSGSQTVRRAVYVDVRRLLGCMSAYGTGVSHGRGSSYILCHLCTYEVTCLKCNVSRIVSNFVVNIDAETLKF